MCRKRRKARESITRRSSKFVRRDHATYLDYGPHPHHPDVQQLFPSDEKIDYWRTPEAALAANDVCAFRPSNARLAKPAEAAQLIAAVAIMARKG